MRRSLGNTEHHPGAAMTLDELAAQEAEIQRTLAGPGLAEELRSRAQRADVPRHWVEVHRGYAALLEDEHSLVSLEALKRAVFLVWFKWAEPNFLTGMWAEWDGGALERTWMALVARLESGNTDPELHWMMAYYNGVCPLPFEQPPAPPSLAELIRRFDPGAWARARWAPGQFENRGRLGSYWASVRRVA